MRALHFASVLPGMIVSCWFAALPAGAYDLDLDSTDSIKQVSKQLAADLVTFYDGDKPGGTPGLLPLPYYWWEAGALMGALVDYWYYTGDDTYNAMTTQGLLHQVGPYNDYMPPNQTLTEGNDDQGFWGMAAMSAAEYKLADPAGEGQPGWLALAQAVFNTQAARWDPGHCGGGLRWQIFNWNNGYDYKNSISQACFFNLAARLALYTGNDTYAAWAARAWDWQVAVGFMDADYRVYDGAHTGDNCTTIVPYEFSYNVGAFLLGASAMYQYTSRGLGGGGGGEDGSSKDNGEDDDDNDVPTKQNSTSSSSISQLWRERTDGLLNATEQIFFFGNETASRVMIEIACEAVDLCDVDQQSFKAYLSRWMAATTKWAPWTFGRVKALLASSARAAAAQCTGGASGRMCGLKWANNSGRWDGTQGVGQQMAALEVVLANMIQQAEAPATNSTGGTSVGDPAAGTAGPGDQSRAAPTGWGYRALGAADLAGAVVCTAAAVLALLAAVVFMVADEKRSAADNWAEFRSSLAGLATGSAFAGRSSSSSAVAVAAAAIPPPRGRDDAKRMWPAMTGGNGGGGGGGGSAAFRPRRAPDMAEHWAPVSRPHAHAGGGGLGRKGGSGRLRKTPPVVT